MAAARLFGCDRDIGTELAAVYRDHPRAWISRARAVFEQNADGSYWARRLSFGGTKHRAAIALVGVGLADAAVAMVAVPYLLASGRLDADDPVLTQLPAQARNALTRQAAAGVLGPDYPPALCRSGLRQQGLIQIFQDFCLTDRSGCARCPFPAALRGRQTAEAETR
jgi:hypothetical protein